MRNKLLHLASLSILVCAFGFAQQPAAEKPTKPAEKPPAKAGTKAAAKDAGKQTTGLKKFGVATEAEKLLDKAIEKIEALPQFRCDVRQSTEMLGYRFTADGQYAVGTDFRMLYELTVHLTDTTGTIKEVCDGRTHWRSQKILDTQELQKLDLKKIREIIDKQQFNKDYRDQIVRRMGFSGILPLMKGLRESQKFETHEEDTLDDVPVYVLHGEWREEVINQASFRGQQLSLVNLPPYLPNKTTVWIGRDNGWPYKVQMESIKKVQGSATVITLEFTKPQIGVQLPESLFIFEPPSGIRPEDQTDLIYQQLNVILQQSQSAERAKPPASPPSAPSGADKSLPTGKPPAPAGDTPSKPGLKP